MKNMMKYQTFLLTGDHKYNFDIYNIHINKSAFYSAFMAFLDQISVLSASQERLFSMELGR
jgi:hypothetical protein